MRELELFYLKNCPYCSKARKAIEELREENPAFAALPIRWIEESEEPELAGRYNVMSIPTLLVVKEGQVVNQAVGARPKSQILSLL